MTANEFSWSYSTRRFVTCLLTLAGLIPSVRARADDWPHWNGPMRTGEYREPGTLKSIPATGLKKVWEASVGLGYSGPAVANGRVYVTEFRKQSGEITNNPGGRDKLKGEEGIQCIDAKTGKVLWNRSEEREYELSYPSGPRATPTIDGTRVYAIGAEGDLVCFEADSGELLWKKSLKAEYKTASPDWGYSAAPFIHGDLLYVLAGGEGSLVVALNKIDGREVWRAISGASIGYCTPSIANLGGIEQLLVWEPKNLHGLEPKTGKTLWTFPIEPKYEMSIIPPTVNGDRLFVSGIGDVASMLQWDSQTGNVRELWKGKVKEALYVANSTPVFDGDYIYGADCQVGTLLCMRASDGKRMWETFQATGGGDRRLSHGTAFLSKVGSLYYLLSETGDFIIAKLSPEKYEEIGRYHVIEPTNESFGRKVVWSYPAYSDRCLFVRNDEQVACYSLAQ